MPLIFHPPQGCIVEVDFSKGFREPEMVKDRLAVVLSPQIEARHHLLTVVALSTTPPDPPAPYHCQFQIPFELPRGWGKRPRWVKGDMVNAVGFHRANLLRLGKDRAGTRVYQLRPLPPDLLRKVRRCVLHGMGLSTLTKHL